MTLVDVLGSQGKNEEGEQLLGELITAVTGDPVQLARLLGQRGVLRARNGRWKGAIADFSKATELKADPNSEDGFVPYYFLGTLLAQTEEMAAYRRHCARMMTVFGETKEPGIAGRCVKACLILPDSGVDLAKVAALAEIGLTDTNVASLWYRQFDKGLAEYRQGRFASGVEWMLKSLSIVRESSQAAENVAEALIVLAMAEYQLKRPAESREALTKGIELIETKLPKLESGNLGQNWQNWIIAHALLREARSLIESKPATAEPAK